MKTNKLLRSSILCGLLLISLMMLSCTKADSSEDIQAEYTRMASTLSTTKVFALGDSLTSGYSYGSTNDTMYFVKGDTSFATLVASQLGSSTGTSNVGFTYPADLTATCAGSAGAGDYSCYTNITHGAPFNLLGVPGVRIEDLESSSITRDYFSTSAQGLFSLIVRNTVTSNSLYNSSMVDQIVLGQPTITLVWIGANNILGPTTGGYVTTTGSDATPITKAEFKTYLENIVSRITNQTSSRIILANLPAPTAIPFVTATNPSLISAGIGQLFMVENGVTTVQSLATYGGQILASAASDITTSGKGAPTNPLLDSDWLSAEELATLNARLTEFNAAISEVGTAYNIPVVDMAAVFNTMATGETETTTGMGLNMTNAFGADAVHPSDTGQKGIANMFIQAINTKYGTSYSQYTP